jgi:hypothetical protein
MILMKIIIHLILANMEFVFEDLQSLKEIASTCKITFNSILARLTISLSNRQIMSSQLSQIIYLMPSKHLNHIVTQNKKELMSLY